MTHKLMGVRVKEYAYHVKKRRQNDSLEFMIMTSQTAHTKCK